MKRCTLSSLFLCCIEIVFFVALFSILFQKEIDVVDLRQIDTVMFVEAIEQARETGKPWSMANKAVRDVVPTFLMTGNELCADKLQSFGRVLKKNILENHAYYAVYWLAPLSYFIDSKVLASAIHVASFVIFLWFVFRALRWFDVPWLPACTFVALMLTHPNWSSAIQGQYYFDRIFLPFGFLLAVFSFSLKDRVANVKDQLIIIVLTILTASLHERAALIVGVFFVLQSYLFKDVYDKRSCYFLFGLGVISGLYSLLIMTTFVSDSLDSNQSLYLEQVIRLLTQGPLIINHPEQAIIFYAVNGLLAFFGLWSPRLLLLAFIIMLPNIIIWAPGAASKTGWTTHYHSYYFPFLVLAAVHGYSMLIKKKMGWMYAPLIALGLAGLSLYLIPYTGQFKLDASAVKDNAVISAINYKNDINSGITTPEDVFRSYQKGMDEYIPSGVRVASVSEDTFMTLHKTREMTFFPIGLSEAEYVILTARVEPQPDMLFHTAINYTGKNEQEKIDRCLQERLINHGFDVNNARNIGYYRVLSRPTGSIE